MAGVLRAALVAAVMLGMGAAPASAVTFTNSDGILINDTDCGAKVGTASPYPSEIAVSELTGTVSDVDVTLTGLAHTFPDDVGVLLVGPGGQAVVLMQDVGGGFDVSDVTLTFDDAAGAALPDSSQMTSGSYLPTIGTFPGGCAGVAFPAPAPAPNAAALSAFNGLDPNGTWQLFVMDDAEGDVGSIDGWSLDFDGVVATPSLVTEVSAAQIALGESFTDTATVSGPAGAPTPTGVAHFLGFGPDDPTCAGEPDLTSFNRPLDNAGQAVSEAFTPAQPGTYRFVATYSGDANYAQASGACNEPNETVVVQAPADWCSGTPAPVGCWHFDEEAGATTALDSSANANDGLYVNGPLLGVPGVLNSAVQLDGHNDHVRVPDDASLDVGNSFTLEGWVKRDTDTRTHQLFNKGGQGFHLVVMDVYNGNQVWLRKANVSTIVRSTGSGVPADGQFHHVVATKDGSTVAIYIDGIAQTLQNVSLAQVIQNTAFGLFFSATPSGNPIDGTIDEYAVYDEPLTADQVQQHFQFGFPQPLTVRSAKRNDSTSARTSRRTAKTSGRSRAAGGSACADLGKPDAGVTAIRANGMSCADAHQLIRGGARHQRAAGMDCEITGEDFSGPVVRITRECTGTRGRTLRYITRS